MNNHSKQKFGSTKPGRLIALICLAMGAFAANSVLCRLALKHTSIDAASFSTIRLISGALMLLFICATQRPSVKLKGNWAGAVALFVYVFSFSFAYIHLETGVGALLLFGAVQLSMILYGLFKGERMRPLAVVGLLLALCGLISLLLPGAAAPDPFSAVVMIISGLAWGIYSLLGKNVTDPIATTTGNFIRAIPFAFIALFPFIQTVNFDQKGLIYAIISGALASGVGYAIWYKAIPNLTAFQGATVQLSVPIIASLAGIFLLGEVLSTRLFLASIAVLGGIVMVLSGKQHG